MTILGIAIGVASIVLISDISQCGADAVSGEMDSLGMGGLLISKSGKTANAVLTENDLSVISKISQVDRSTPVIMTSSKVQTKKTTTESVLWGIDANAAGIVSISPIYGRLFNRREIVTSANVCLVDESFAMKAYGRSNIVGKKISIICESGTQEFEVVGVIKTGTGLLQNIIGTYIPNFVYIPYTTMQLLCQRDDFDEIIVKLKSTADSTAVSRQILSRLDAEKGTTEAFLANNLAKQKDSLLKVMDIVTLILSAVGAVSLLVASLSIMTMMTVSVTERTREIGIKKALGATGFDIMKEFLIEALLLSVIGSLLGCAIGIGASVIFCAVFHSEISLRLDIMLIASGIAVFSGTVFSVYPAYQASRLRPVDALRQE